MRETLLLKPEEELILLAADIRPEKTILNRLDELIPAISDWTVFTKMALERAASLRTLSRNMLLLNKFQVLNMFTHKEICHIGSFIPTWFGH